MCLLVLLIINTKRGSSEAHSGADLMLVTFDGYVCLGVGIFWIIRLNQLII